MLTLYLLTLPADTFCKQFGCSSGTTFHWLSYIDDISEMNFNSPEPKSPGELMGWDSNRGASVHPSMRASTLSSMNIQLADQN